MNRTILIRVGLILLFFYATVFVFSRVFGIGLYEIQQFVASFGILGPLIYMVLLLLGLTIPFNPVSDFLIVNVAALLFPPHVSILCTFIVHSLAITINYKVGMKYGGKMLEKVTSQKHNHIVDKVLEKLSLKMIFLLRFILPTSNVVGVEMISYASGLKKVPFGGFFLASIIPWTILSVLYFYSTYLLRDKSLQLYFLPAILLVGLPTAVFFLIFKIRKKRRSLTLK